LIGVWYFVATWATWAFMAWRGYQVKSVVYRFLWERKYLKAEIVTFATLAELSNFISHGDLWQPDSWRSGFDAVITPGRAQAIFSGAEPAPVEDFDCDDHAIFVVASATRAIDRGVMHTEGVAQPRFFTVTWMRMDTGEATGHNVCLFEVPQGSDRPSKWCFMDYGGPSAHLEEIHQVARAVMLNYAGGPAKLLVWCVQTENLTPVLTHRGDRA
jgi:hypothetical protein